MPEADEYRVGYGRPPKASQFKKGQSGNTKGRRKKGGAIKVDTSSILNEVFSVQSGGQVKHMSAEEIGLRRLVKKAIEKKHFPSMAYLLGLFEKYGCAEQPQRSGVINLPTNSMPHRMALEILSKFGPPPWNKRHVAWGRKRYEATKTQLEREFEEAGILP